MDETAKEIKAALNAAGFKQNQVTVRYKRCLYDNVYDVTIRDPDSSWENIPVEINGRTYYLNKMDSHRPNLCGPRAENIEKGLIGNRWVKQIQNPEDSEDPKNAFEEAAETIAQRIAENELDIGYINRNAKKNEVNK